MSNYENNLVLKIREQYTEREVTKLDELKALDKKVKRPAEVFSYIFGAVGSLVLGTGMCLAMKVIGDFMVPGILIGLLGIAMVSSTYFIHNKLIISRKRKYADDIIKLSDSIINPELQ